MVDLVPRQWAGRLAVGPVDLIPRDGELSYVGHRADCEWHTVARFTSSSVRLKNATKEIWLLFTHQYRPRGRCQGLIANHRVTNAPSTKCG